MSDAMLMAFYWIVFVVDGLVFSFLPFDFMSKVNRDIYRRKWCYVAAFLVYCGLILLTAIFLPKIHLFLSLSGVLLIGWMMFSRKRIQILYNLIFLLCLFCCQILAIMGTQLICLNMGVSFQSPIVGSILLMLVKQFVCIAASRFLLLFFQRRQVDRIPVFSYVNFLVLPVLSGILMVSLLYMSELHLALYSDYGLFLLNYLLLMGLNLYVTYVFNAVWEKQALEHEVELYQQQEQMQYRYYETLEEKYQASRKLIHDFQNHLMVLEKLYQGGDAQAGKVYAGELQQKLGKLGRTYYSDQKMLNIILNEKIPQAKAAGIRTEVMLGEFPENALPDVDITTIFSNLLDNALEAASQAGPDAFLSLTTDSHGDFLVIRMQNSMTGSLRKQRGTLLSTKRGHEGLGLSSVKRVVEKHGGTVKITKPEQMFEVNLVIPIERTECISGKEEAGENFPSAQKENERK